MTTPLSPVVSQPSSPQRLQSGPSTATTTTTTTTQIRWHSAAKRPWDTPTAASTTTSKRRAWDAPATPTKRKPWDPAPPTPQDDKDGDETADQEEDEESASDAEEEDDEDDESVTLTHRERRQLEKQAVRAWRQEENEKEGVTRNAAGELYYDLVKKRRLTVQTKGTGVFVDLRQVRTR